LADILFTAIPDSSSSDNEGIRMAPDAFVIQIECDYSVAKKYRVFSEMPKQL